MTRRAVLNTCVAVALSGIAACSDREPETICQFSDADEPGIRVMAGEDTYFYAEDRAGKQLGYQRGGGVLALEPGDYGAQLNGSRHPVTVRRGQVTTCSVATLVTTGTTGEYYYVLDTLDAQLTYARLSHPTALFPGDYIARVNNSISRINLRPRDTTTLASGTVMVTGTTDEYYYVMTTDGTQMAYARLGQPLALLAGDYLARVNNSTSPFTVDPGGTRQIASGTVIGKGSTDQYYYVADTLGAQLAYARLGNPLAYLPGVYQFRIVSTDLRMTIRPGQVTEIVTGTLVVTGPPEDYYYILDMAGNQLGYARLNTPTSLLAGSYIVRAGTGSRDVTITAGETMSLAVAVSLR